MECISAQYIEALPDPSTDERLLPGFMQRGDNSEQMQCRKIALRIAMEHVLSDEQKQLVHMRYWLGMRNSHIARELGLSAATIGKRLENTLNLLRKYVGFCVQVYNAMLLQDGNRAKEEYQINATFYNKS